MTGRVLNIETMEPVIAYLWQGNNALGITDDQGRFNIALLAPARVRLSAVGYKGASADIYAEEGNELWMEPTVTELDPVIITPDPRPDPGPVAAVIPWPWIFLLALAALASKQPRRRRS